MSEPVLTVLYPDRQPNSRCGATLDAAVRSHPSQVLTALSPDQPLTGHRLLFVLSLDEYGMSPAQCELLRTLRQYPHLLDGCVGGILVDGAGALYTKAAARNLALAISQAGCLLIGRPLVEATGGLQNFSVQARNAKCSVEQAYRLAAENLVRRILAFEAIRSARPRITVLHASNHRTSNTMALWDKVRSRVEDACDITEIGLRNGTLEDCAGCPYTMCLHFGEKDSCFYGGVMVDDVYPSIREANAILLICPNYNDTLSANLTACINRLTALYRTTTFDQKALFGIIVSGYSGSDLVAQQLISALCMNKSFYLPPRFCMMETANDAGTAVRLPGIEERLDGFAQNIRAQLCVPEETQSADMV